MNFLTALLLFILGFFFGGVFVIVMALCAISAEGRSEEEEIEAIKAMQGEK